MIYPDNFENKIGFAEIRNKLTDFCITADAKRIAGKISFQTDSKRIYKILKETEEMRISLSEYNLTKRFLFDPPYDSDLSIIVEKLECDGSSLTEEQCIQLLAVIRCLNTIVRYFEIQNQDVLKRYPFLSRIASMIVDIHPVQKEIERIFDREGNIKDDASSALYQIRSEIRNIGKNLGSTIQKILASAAAKGLVDPDVTPVIREGRLVVPIQPMYKRAFGGIVHGESSTGRTLFVEPTGMVELNNRVRELELEEKREIVSILNNLTAFLRTYESEIRNNLKILVSFDFIHAKANLAIEQDGRLPHITSSPEIEWYHAINPTLRRSLKQQKREPVPLDITINNGSRILVVSGPNAGGKSVLLKTVGLLQYMVQCGLLPPCYSNSHFGIFKDIFLDIGDNQSIDDDLSTYSSHLQTMKTFLNKGNPASLVLIDEFGSGTEPVIGGAIAEAVLIELNRKGCWGVITTHYQNLKRLAEDTTGLVNGSMLFDRTEMKPLFILSTGSAGSSFAIEIARKAGLPKYIIDKATEIVGQDYVDSDKYLLDINRDRKYWENKRYDIKIKEKRLDELIEKWEKVADEIKTQRKTLINQAKKDAEKIISEANSSIEKTIREIKESQAEKVATKASRKELADFKNKLREDYEENTIAAPLLRRPRKEIRKKNKNPESTTEKKGVAIGDIVVLDGKGISGEVIDINASKATVGFGGTKVVVDVSRLIHSIDKKSHVVKISTVFTQQSLESENERRKGFKPEIDIRGMRSDEAVQAITYFIDDAIQFNISPIRILHGTGTGALREAVRNYLNALKGKLDFHDEDIRLGGSGITVVNFI